MPARSVLVSVGAFVLSLAVGLGALRPAPSGASVDMPGSSAALAFPDVAPSLELKPRPSSPELVYLDRCEGLRVDDEGRLRRVRLPLSKAQRDRQRREMRETIRRTAAAFEPGEARELAAALSAWALRESSYRPEALHVLSPDLDAAASSSRRVEASHAFSKATVPLHFPDGKTADVDAWEFSRGLFGMAPALWLRRWDAGTESTPPWALCDERVALATAIWAARAHLRECVSRGYPSTWRTLNRRFSSGHCEERPERFERSWTHRARGQGLDPDASVRFAGRALPESTPRHELLAALPRGSEKPSPAPW